MTMSASYRLTGALDAARLEDAAAAVVRRHEILRSAGEGLLPGWTRHDLTDLTDQARKLRLEVLARREFATPLDLTTDAPLRLTLIRTGTAEHVLLVVAARAVWDDASWRVFLSELTHAYDDPQRYARQPVVTAPPPGHRNRADEVRYWQSVLTDLPEPLELPGPTGSVVPRTLRAGVCIRRLAAAVMDRVSALARDTATSPYVVLTAAFSALIARYTQTDDFLIASGVLRRTDAQAIGPLGTTVVLRARVSPRDTFRELVFRMNEAADGASTHRRGVPDGAQQLARLGFALREPEGDGFCPAGVTCRRAGLRLPVGTRPLSVTVESTADGALLEAEYLVEVLDRELVTRLLGHFEQLLESALRQPDTPVYALGMLGADPVWLQSVAQGERYVAPPATLAAIVEAQVDATPSAIAVTHEDLQYSYRDINRRANRLAHWLIGRGLGAEDVVAVTLDRSPELVVAALGIAKAGAVYLPIDPDYPSARIAAILRDAAPKLVLREPVGGLDAYPAHNPTDDDRVRPLAPDNLAYIIYTSGSTGTPKGVPLAHAPVAEYLAWFGQYRDDTPDSVLQVASIGFDASIEEIFGTLGSGARLVIPRPDGLRDVGYLTGLLEREGITAMHLVPSLLGLFLSFPGVRRWRTLRRVPIGGEALPGELADRFHATFDALLDNFYGPTEAAVASTTYRVVGKQGNRTVPIGRPKFNTTVHLLDDMLRPVPVGAIGEIYIGGTCLARGYLGRPGLTAERFLADPYRPGGRMYRSGDLARRNADGDLEFVGRADEQVKVGGYRIELGEVAAAASVDPTVGQCVVVVRDLPSTGRALVAYMTPSAECDAVDVDRVRARVSAALPDYMIPAAYVVLDEMPITTHGKFDRDALPEPFEYRSAS